uniref:Olfactomedin like 1 n=1 Tax=Meleagris gallopavo TaxID=9103 RepID=A0A803XUA1_MELGA
MPNNFLCKDKHGQESNLRYICVEQILELGFEIFLLLKKCNQDILDYVEEFQDFSKMVLSRLSGLNSYKTEVKDEVENLLTRVERAQRDIDYFGSVRDSKMCVEVDEDLVKQQLLEEAEEKRNLKSCCDHLLASVKSLKMVKKTGDKHGSWMKDPGKKHTKIYLLNGTVNNVIFEFPNIMTFMESNHTLKARRVILPFPWEGTGHIIYQDFLAYFHKNFTIFIECIAAQATFGLTNTLVAVRYSHLSATICHFSIFFSVSLFICRREHSYICSEPHAVVLLISNCFLSTISI